MPGVIGMLGYAKGANKNPCPYEAYILLEEIYNKYSK